MHGIKVDLIFLNNPYGLFRKKIGEILEIVHENISDIKLGKVT